MLRALAFGVVAPAKLGLENTILNKAPLLFAIKKAGPRCDANVKFYHTPVKTLKGWFPHRVSRLYSTSKTPARHLNIKYLNRLVEIKTSELDRLTDVYIAISEFLKNTDASPDRIALRFKDGSRVTKFDDIPEEYYTESGPCLSAELLSDSTPLIINGTKLSSLDPQSLHGPSLKVRKSKFINIDHLNVTQLEVSDIEVLSQLNRLISEYFSDSFPVPARVKVLLADGSRVTKFQDIPKEYFMESGPCLSIELLPSIKEKNLLEKVQPKSKEARKLTERIVTTSGSNFLLVDRDDSFKVLADAIEKRFGYWEQGDKDKLNHPIPILAAGPGTGKSRFVQELPKTFLSYVSRHYSEKFNQVVQPALFLNISFGNGTAYTPDEISIGMDKSIALRILFQLDPEDCHLFVTFVNEKKDKDVSLEALFIKLANDAPCIFLGLDEINKVHGASVEKFKVLIALIGSMSCTMKPFLVPILAGTVIGPVNQIITDSMHDVCMIPLPLLSYESSLKMIENVDPKLTNLLKNDSEFEKMVFDMGGHPRALEYLIARVTEEFDQYGHGQTTFDRVQWEDIGVWVRHKLTTKYRLDQLQLGAAIAHSFLGIPAFDYEQYPDSKTLTFLNLEEKGLIKLEGDLVKIPFIFISCVLHRNALKMSEFCKVIFTRYVMEWQRWEQFNVDYFAFRLSLFAHLPNRNIKLQTFFKGSQMNLADEDMEITIPETRFIKVQKAAYQFPKKVQDFDFGVSVLNVANSPFDSFMYLQKQDGTKLLLAIQSKWSASKTPTTISQKEFDQEFTKSKKAIKKYLGKKLDFIFVFIGHREADPITLPPNCVLVSKSEESAFFGDTITYRLNHGIEKR